MSMRYDAKMPSNTYDTADYEALRASNIPATLSQIPGLRFDSAEDASVFFARELDYIKTKTYDRLYPEFTALTLFPVTHEVPEGAETVTYYSYDKTGMAKIISNYANDLPRVDVKGEPTSVPVKSVGDSYGYSVQEMRASRYAGKSLDVRKAETARYQIDRITNVIAWKGDKKAKLPGVLSEDNDIPIFAVPTKEGRTTWAEKEADEVLADISGMLQQVSKTTMNVERPDNLAIPSDTYIGLATKRIPMTDKTILTFLKENLPGIKDIVSSAELNSIATDTNPYAAGDTSGKGVALLYTKDPEKLSIEIPMPFFQHPLQYNKLEVEVACESRVVGAMIYYPLSALIAVGV